MRPRLEIIIVIFIQTMNLQGRALPECKWICQGKILIFAGSPLSFCLLRNIKFFYITDAHTHLCKVCCLSMRMNLWMKPAGINRFFIYFLPDRTAKAVSEIFQSVKVLLCVSPCVISSLNMLLALLPSVHGGGRQHIACEKS